MRNLLIWGHYEPVGLQFIGSERVGHDWATELTRYTQRLLRTFSGSSVCFVREAERSCHSLNTTLNLLYEHYPQCIYSHCAVVKAKFNCIQLWMIFNAVVWLYYVTVHIIYEKSGSTIFKEGKLSTERLNTRSKAILHKSRQQKPGLWVQVTLFQYPRSILFMWSKFLA